VTAPTRSRDAGGSGGGAPRLSPLRHSRYALGLRDDSRGKPHACCPSEHSATFLLVISTTLSLVVDRQTGSGHHHIGLGRAHKGRRVKLLIADQSIRVIALDGELIRELTLDPTRDYQPLQQP
jgi:hypothetical protein